MSDATTPRLKVSREGVVLIKSFEGFRPRALRHEDGGWVIGYGHRASARLGLTVSEQDAELLLQYDLLPVVKALNEQVPVPLNQHQFDALASFAISVGVDRFLGSDVLQQLNAGRAGAAADALIGWPEQTPPDARLRRRAAERALFVADPGMPVHLSDLLAAPLPPPPVEAPSAPAPVVRPDFSAHPDARAAAVASLLGEAPAGDEPAPFQPVALQAAPAATTVHLQRYSPYADAAIGPLPGFPAAPAPPPADEAVEPEPEPSIDATPASVAADPSPVVPLVPPPPGASPFPPMEAPLVLTPPADPDWTEVVRPAWGPEERARAAGAEDGAVLFDDEPGLAVLRHEVETVPARRFDWGETGAFVIMGLIGLAACAFSAASFRKAMGEAGVLGDFTLIGWVLALIGVVCVGVSSWNLYRRWTRRD